MRGRGRFHSCQPVAVLYPGFRHLRQHAEPQPEYAKKILVLTVVQLIVGVVAAIIFALSGAVK
jgi:hypothetical protein